MKKRRWQCRTGLSYIITLHYISYSHRWMLLFFVTLWMLLFFVTGDISTSLIYCWGDNINQCVGISERKATTERGCLLLQAETWLLCRVAPLRADSGLQCCCKASEAVRQTEGFVVQAGQCGSSAHIHPWFLCCPNCLTCSESLCWWVSVLKRHGIVLLPLVWMSFRGQSSCVSATQICLTVKFVLSIDWFLVCVFFYWINVGCSLKQHKWELFRSLFHEAFWYAVLLPHTYHWLFPWLHFLLQNCFHIFTWKSKSLRAALNSHGDVFPPVQAQVGPEASAWISGVCE